MLGKWNYENYTKAIVPLVLAVGALLVNWVDAGELNRAELGNVIWLGIAALLVFLAPNIPIAKEKLVDSDPNLVQGQQAAANAPPTQRVQSRSAVQGPLAEEPKTEETPTRRPRRRSAKED